MIHVAVTCMRFNAEVVTTSLTKSGQLIRRNFLGGLEFIYSDERFESFRFQFKSDLHVTALFGLLSCDFHKKICKQCQKIQHCT